MSTDRNNRRKFIKQSAAVLGGMGLPAAVHAAQRKPPAGPIRIGAPILDEVDDPELLAMAHRDLGYRASYCPDVDLNDGQRIRDISAAFTKHDVVIAEVGRWCNLMDADEKRRQGNLQKVTDGLALAEAIGARCCVDIAGSFSTTAWFGPHPDNLSPRFFEAAVENARRIIDAVKPRRARFCYEMMGWALPDTPDSYLKLIKAIDRPAFGVHLDPCNLVNSPSKFYRNTDLLNECFDKLGAWIVSCHAKDLAWEIEMNVHFREVVPGQGELDYATYLRRLAALPQDPPLMLEHLSGPEEYAAGRVHILAVGREAGIRFE